MVTLNPKQREIVKYTGSKPLSVEAGPGAGKTRVIIERVKYLVNEVKINPESLLVITFTRKAAEELKERLADSDISKSDIDLMQISTIHGFCSKILEDSGSIGFDVIDDDLGEKNNMFISRYLKELGFKDEFTVKPRDVRDIVRKYNEYTTFNVDTQKLIEYIKKERPISTEYLTFVRSYMEANDGKFPANEIQEDDDLKKSYYNAKYLKIAESYPKYLQLLQEKNLTDFSMMQVDTLKFLKRNPKTQFTNVLIDEFQDTDPVQMQIFEILMENADSFTVVGDVDQSIYGFRGSIENYFEKLFDARGDDLERMDLSVNFRSTNEIIDISEDFIKSQRAKHASKGDAVGNRDINRDVYYLINEDSKSEAERIVETIEHLYYSGKIENYNEVGILLRSVKSESNCIDPLIKLLNEKNIPFQVKGRSDLLLRDEIKSILTLLYHIIRNEDENNHVFNSWERDWLTLKAFTGAKFNQVLVNLSDETKEILNNVQDRFEREVIDTEKVVYKEFTDKTSRVRKFSGVLNRDEEILVEIFNRVERPVLTMDNLEKYGVTNTDDLTFFYLLNSIRDDYLDEDIEYNKRPTILDIYLRLLTITDYLDEEFINNQENKHIVENLALLSNTLFNYEQVRNPKDLSGAFWFIYHNIDEYGAFAEERNAVQIMTVHKSKGLEFPVVIIASLAEGSFPMSFKDPNPKSGWAFIGGKMRPVYYSPNNCLEYKPFETQEEEIIAHDEEEERIVYVAITRAKDTLILSTISPPGSTELLNKALKYQNNPDLDIITKQNYFKLIPKGPEKIQNIIDSNIEYCKALNDNYDLIEKTVCEKPKEESKLIKLSFTSLENYQQCPFKFRLTNEFNFKTSENKYIKRGIFIHNLFNIINQKIKQNNNVYIGDEDVKGIVTNLFYKSKVEDTIDENEENKLNRIIEDILEYYHGFGANLKIVDSEVPFYIKKKNYSLNGAIDLIFETEDGNIGILDYKNTKSANNYLEKYIRQLYTYILGLQDESNKFKEHTIDKLYIYAIKSKKAVEIPINPIEIKELALEIDETAKNIEEENYSCAKGNHCDKCSYSYICKNQKNTVDVPEFTSQSPKVNFCSNCGNKLEADMKFCPNCGNKL